MTDTKSFFYYDLYRALLKYGKSAPLVRFLGVSFELLDLNWYLSILSLWSHQQKEKAWSLWGTMSYTALGPANKIDYVPSTLSKMECTARYSNLITNVYWLHTSTQILNWTLTPWRTEGDICSRENSSSRLKLPCWRVWPTCPLSN